MTRQRKARAQQRGSRPRILFKALCAGSSLSLLMVACAYEPLTDAEKAGIGAAGAEPVLGEDETTSDASASTGGSAATSTTGSNGSGGVEASSATETSTTSASASDGGTGGTSTTGSGGSPDGASTTSATTLSSGGTGSTGGSGGTGGVGGSGSGGASGTDGGGVTGSGGTGQTNAFRYLRLVALSSQNGNPFSAIAELEILGASGQSLDNSTWTASADSEETVDETAPASQAIDGDPDTFWHTEWGSIDAPLPHYLQIDLGSAEEITGFIYTPRQDGQQNGWIRNWELYLSNSASDPGTAVDSGSFATGSTPKTVNLP